MKSILLATAGAVILSLASLYPSTAKAQGPHHGHRPHVSHHYHQQGGYRGYNSYGWTQPYSGGSYYGGGYYGGGYSGGGYRAPHSGYNSGHHHHRSGIGIHLGW